MFWGIVQVSQSGKAKDHTRKEKKKEEEEEDEGEGRREIEGGSKETITK